VSIRDAKETLTDKLGEVHFALGRALWEAGMERSRALELAVRARAEYLATPATPATQRELGAIDLWLANHGRSIDADVVAVPIVRQEDSYDE
jgi:hypothetical protein